MHKKGIKQVERVRRDHGTGRSDGHVPESETTWNIAEIAYEQDKKGVEKYSKKPDSQFSASWISSFFSSVNRLPLLDGSAHPLFFGLSGPLGGQSLLYFGEQSAKIGNDDR